MKEKERKSLLFLHRDNEIRWQKYAFRDLPYLPNRLFDYFIAPSIDRSSSRKARGHSHASSLKAQKDCDQNA